MRKKGSLIPVIVAFVLLLALGILLKQHILLRIMTSFVCLDCIGIGGLGP